MAATKKPATGAKRGRKPGQVVKKKAKQSFKIYVYKVLKQVHPESGEMPLRSDNASIYRIL